MSDGPGDDATYRPLSRRRRWLVLVLGVATGVAAVLLLTDTPGRQWSHPRIRAGPAVCADGRGSGCVGGTATVLVVPAASAPVTSGSRPR